MSRLPVRSPRPPALPAVRRLALTRRSAIGLTLSSSLAALLIFTSGLAIGVRVQLATSDAVAATAESAEPGAATIGAPGTNRTRVPDRAGVFLPAAGPADGTASGVGVDAGAAGPGAAAAVAAPPEESFLLQFGAFRVEENAERLHALLSARGYGVEIRTTGGAGATLYRVVSGDFTSEAAAERVAERIRIDSGVEVYVMGAGELGS